MLYDEMNDFAKYLTLGLIALFVVAALEVLCLLLVKWGEWLLWII